MSSFSAALRNASRLVSVGIKQGLHGGKESFASSSLNSLPPNRAFAAGGDHHHNVITYAGLSLHKPTGWQVTAGKVMAGVMWFWIFYRFYHDYDTFLFGHAQHFEHELHTEEKHVEKKH